MDRILYTAMSGAKQSLDQQSVVNHNLSNAATAGFRAQLHAMRAVPVEGDGLLATRTSVAATTPGSDFSHGPVSTTGRELDVALEGSGWLAVQTDDGGEAYTRRGDLQVDGNGMLTSVGRPVIGDDGPIIVPLEAQLSIGADGTISAIGPGEDPTALVPVGQLKLVDPEDQTLTRGDDGLFRLPPGDDGEVPILAANQDVRVVSGSLEGSNVSAIESMVAMIDTQRRYDMQMKVIDSADENAQRANNLLSIQG
ncbi:flagellar basal-body rod protein FlgF [Franzmannia pantelleriensis]|uniref:Flagellar basal-body rod protein FlgF n=1 Tax=Franzmannia pantelleriensis TaxID=48727 RepID=A0A1G9MDP0_9GAMM|nr:flagellar basal body rod protein FlgF [Halomonas pantelleriensis]SDL72376.1 flagellar basal-body rod protein FlgF [Halomonas pantelleriensis]